MSRQTIVGIGGFPDAALVDYVLGLAGGRQVLVDTTASPERELEWPDDWSAEPTHLSFYPWPPEGLRELALSQDAILVCGGNTANMLAVWRVHGFDRILREAWESGVVLFGWSAGMICWFEAGVTDSYGSQLEGMRDGLGFLPGAPVRITTTKTGAVPSTGTSLRTASRRASRSTPPQLPASRERSSRRSSPRLPSPAATASGRTARRRSRRAHPLSSAAAPGTPRPTRACAGRARSA
jgi:hypothetical protein